MAVKERDVVLMSQENGDQNLDYPITRLKNIEATAQVKAAPADGDYVPVLDSADGEQMKKIAWGVLRQSLGGSAFELAFAEADWTAGGDGTYTITIPQSAHQRQSSAFGCRLWHSVDGVLQSDTWAVVGTQAVWNSADGSVTLRAADAYSGVGYFYDL